MATVSLHGYGFPTWLRFPYMLRNDSYLERGEDFLARLVAGGGELGQELRLFHPAFELVAGRLGGVVGEIKLSQFLEAVCSNREICHVMFCVVEMIGENFGDDR